jgi:MGT family glycosyltransferase
MATVCMIGHPAPGHINPTLPVIAELVRRGERAFYFATEPFRDKIEQAGAVFRSFGDHSLFERNLAHGGILGGMSGLMESAEAVLPALIQQVEHDAPDYLLVEAHALWGNLLVQILELPAITLCSMFAMNDKLISVERLAAHLYASAESTCEGLLELNRYFGIARRVDRRYGTRSPGVIDYLGNAQELNIVFTSRGFQIGAEAFGANYRFVGPTSGIRMEGAGAASDFDLSALHAPVILIAMGTMYNEEIALYKACFEAFEDSPWQIVMSVGHRIDLLALGAIPANFLVLRYVPQLDVLARSALFITHGGINSAHEAMLCGVPMVVLPAAADHFVVAGQVEAVGAGVMLDRKQASAQLLRKRAERVLHDPIFREHSAKMGEALRASGGASSAADEILDFIQRKATSREANHVRISAEIQEAPDNRAGWRAYRQ